MRLDYPNRVKMGAVFVLLIALYSGVTLLVTVNERRAQRKAARQGAAVDWATLYERRFARLRQDLPPDSVVGYVRGRGPGTGKDLRMTQYVLAPVIVRESLKEDLLVGDFHDPRAMPDVIRRENLVLVRDYGAGVALLRRKAE